MPTVGATMLSELTNRAGTYVMIYRCRSRANIRVGRWGRLKLEPGYYLYVGSAFGPGGVRARVLRHWRRDKSSHWHIDYLRLYVGPVETWFCHDRVRLEHRWAKALSSIGGMGAIPGFGCTDCNCETHFFRAAKGPTLGCFARLVGRKVVAWTPNASSWVDHGRHGV